eukprot:20004-Hanusia_phi.AAC.1
MSGILECMLPEQTTTQWAAGRSTQHQSSNTASSAPSHKPSEEHTPVKFSGVSLDLAASWTGPSKPGQRRKDFWLWEFLPSPIPDSSRGHGSISVQQNGVNPQQQTASSEADDQNLTGEINKSEWKSELFSPRYVDDEWKILRNDQWNVRFGRRVGVGLLLLRERSKFIVHGFLRGSASSKCDDLRKGDILHKVDGKLVDGMSRFEVNMALHCKHDQVDSFPAGCFFDLGATRNFCGFDVLASRLIAHLQAHGARSRREYHTWVSDVALAEPQARKHCLAQDAPGRSQVCAVRVSTTAEDDWSVQIPECYRLVLSRTSRGDRGGRIRFPLLRTTTLVLRP